MNSDDHSINDTRTLRSGKPPSGSGDAASINSLDTLKPDYASLGAIDRYELIEELGGGGFGCVYKARDTVAGIEVAVKGLPPLVQHNRKELDRVRENFALVSRLHHPHIAAPLVLHQAQQVWYADESVRRKLRVLEGDFLFVMSFAPGVTLSQWRRQFPEGKAPVDQALAICAQIAEALDYAHGEKIVHRDIKPSNVMVETVAKDEGGRRKAEVRVRVLDFGLAAEIRSSMSRISQETGDTSGTRPYMAPEQWQGRKQGAYTDQYALAVLFYELVSGVVPFAPAFETGDPVIMTNVVTREQPEPLPELSKRQNAVLLRALAKEPAERLESCGAFVAGLAGGKLRNTRKARKVGRTLRVSRLVGFAALLAALAAAGYIGYPRYREYQARVAAEAEAARESALQDAATRARMAELRQSVESALANGDLQEAGRLLGELESEGTTSVSFALRDRYEGLAGDRETNRRYADASLARERVQPIDRGQTLGDRLESLERRWREAEAARQGRSWGQALSAYDAVLRLAEELQALDAARGVAEARKGEAETARREAQSANVSADAADLWTAGGRASSRAAERFETGDFEAAAKTWAEATTAYQGATTRSRAVQAYRKAKNDYETALGGPTSLPGRQAGVSAVILESHGGDRWREVLRQARVGEVSSGDPAEGRRAYEQALAGLPAAVEESRQRQRTAQIDTALTEARAAKQRERWQEVIAAADRALALEAGNREAQALKREAEGNLVPTWKIVTTVGGREVPGTITIGGQNYRSGQAIPLREGKRYIAEFSYEAAGKRYRADSVTETANWRGERERRIAMEEVRSPPVAGQNWTSPATGMEFVWIPQMNMWVGKFEVTNAEYRRKEPRHDSGSSGNHSLNGDRQPVVQVNFDDAKAYAEWLTQQDRAALGGAQYRLPSEQEWVTYAQCGDGRVYPWGNNWPPRSGQAGNYADDMAKRSFSSWTVIAGYNDGFAVTAPVDRLWRNPWGLYGVGGNVWEACASGAWRGASWDSRSQDYLRVSYRDDDFELVRDPRNYGFRLVLSLQ